MGRIAEGIEIFRRSVRSIGGRNYYDGKIFDDEEDGLTLTGRFCLHLVP
jgi:hypothetical protein